MRELGALTSAEPDYGSSVRAVKRASDNSPRYIRITDFGEDGIEPDHEFLTPESVEWDSELAVGDVLFARSGATVGKTYLHEDSSERAIFAGYCIRFKFDESKASPRFVYWWTKTQAYARWSAAIQRPSGQPNINKEEFKACPIPLPSICVQDELTALLDDARDERKAKLAEADALLKGVDDFVMDALGIAASSPQKRVFAIKSSGRMGVRLDADFHSLRFKTIRDRLENGRYPSASVEEICEPIKSGFAAGRQKQAFDYESGVPHLRPLNMDLFGRISLEGTKFVPKKSVGEGNACVRGEVLFNNTNSTEIVGKSAVFDLEQVCACSNHMTRLAPKRGINPEYLASVLNVLRSLGYLGLLSTNFNNQAGINTETLGQIRIPRPPLAEQERIAAEIIRRRRTARQLRAEAEAGWRSAKRGFEDRVLGG